MGRLLFQARHWRVRQPRRLVHGLAVLAALAAPAAFAAAASAEGPARLLSATLHEPREGLVAAPLPNGEVLIAGGYNGSKDLNTAELYNPANESFEQLSEKKDEERTVRCRCRATSQRRGLDRRRLQRLNGREHRRTVQP